MPIHYLPAGDWNESPDSYGRYSPTWIARKGGLDKYDPEFGKHGRIDFILSSAGVTGVRRIKGGESDHGLVAFTVYASSDRILRGAIWNVERDRSNREIEVMVDFISEVAHAEKLDFLLLNETQDYHHGPHRGPLAYVKDYRLIAADSPPGAKHNSILVHSSVDISNVVFKQMSTRGWTAGGGGAHHPLFDTMVTLDRWLRVAAVHEVNGVDWVNGKMVGPEDRKRARRQSARRKVRIARRIARRRRSS